jgi:peptidyl-prolyl cis-trans isomerase D
LHTLFGTATAQARRRRQREFYQAMMKELREKTKWVMLVVVLAFVGLMVFEWGMDISGRSAGAETGALGEVDGQPIQYQAYMEVYQNLYQRAQQQSGGQLSREQIRQLEDMAFEQVVSQMLIQQELERRGIRVSNAEIAQAARWMPHPDLMQNELFQTNGQFDLSKYQQFLASPQANDELLLQLERYYREVLPQAKLMRQVTSGLFISDAELWRAYRDRNETATVNYVVLDLSRLVPGDLEVTEREIRDHYNRNRDQFRRSASAQFTMAVLPRAATAADTAAALERARAVRAEIVGGADFAEVARRESADPGSREQGGDLGRFTRGRMVPEFDQAVFSLPLNQVSEPVQTQFGYHLLQVLEREGDEARARHILIPFERGEESEDRLYARADSLELVGQRAGIERAARVLEAQLRENVVVTSTDAMLPGVGSLMEALEWAQDETRDGTPMGTVSPLFETPEAFYVVRLDAFTPAGEIPLAEATPQIRRQLMLDKKREQARQIGQQMVAEVRGGKPLQQAASERGLQVQATGPFSRTGFNPTFGQANAAIGAAFGTPLGQVSNVVETTAGLFLIQPTERSEADRQTWEAQKEQQRTIDTMRAQQEMIGRWMQDLRTRAEIEDRRAEVLQRRT